MCKEQEVRVKREYLLSIFLDNKYTDKALKESRKMYFTLDDFIELRQSPYSNAGRGYPHADLLERRFNEALKLQRKAECNSSKPELTSNDELQYHLTRSIELLNSKSDEFRSISENLTQIKNKLSNN